MNSLWCLSNGCYLATELIFFVYDGTIFLLPPPQCCPSLMRMYGCRLRKRISPSFWAHFSTQESSQDSLSAAFLRAVDQIYEDVAKEVIIKNSHRGLRMFILSISYMYKAQSGF